MPALLVHGVPETSQLWDPLDAELARTDVLAPSLPGFGCPRPDGFAATKEDYLDWLVAEVERAGADGPVDLVGHDWGGLLVVRLVSTRPELVRSFVTDAAGVAHPRFDWHGFAKIWQTPGEGEAWFERSLAASAEERAGAYEAMDVPPEWALRLGEWSDETMAGCILALYRSATGIGAEWGPGFRAIDAPGLVLAPAADPFGGVGGSEHGARQAGVPCAVLEGLGHWWMLQDPARGAAELERFWATLD